MSADAIRRVDELIAHLSTSIEAAGKNAESVTVAPGDLLAENMVRLHRAYRNRFENARDQARQLRMTLVEDEAALRQLADEGAVDGVVYP